MHGRRVRNLISPVVRGLLVIGMLAVTIISRDPILIIFGIIFFFTLGLFPIVAVVRELVDIRRTRRAWNRAASGDVRQVLVGIALPWVRMTADHPVHTVVVPEAGQARLVRLAVTHESPRLAPGPVEVDLFDPEKVRAPARLRPLNGPVVWAFAKRNGGFALTGKPWKLENGWQTSWRDDWPDYIEHIDPEFDSYSKYRGGRGGLGGGDGDGGGGE
jgi:hypothetical protein